MKKILSIILASIIILASLSIFVSAEVVENTATLKFNSNGKFKILHVCDIQDTFCSAPQALDYIAAICDSEKPDLVILGGDNIRGTAGRGLTDFTAEIKVKIAIDRYMSIFEERNIPTAIVFGNHDGEKRVSKETQMKMYMEYDCCVAIDEGEDLYGCGTYNVPIKSSDGTKISYNLWFFDSGAKYEDSYDYDYIRDDQVNWYVEKSNELKEANGGENVPSMAFQHIVVPEIYDAIESGTLIEGEVNEYPTPSKYRSKQFETILQQGDVKAMFFGHDHVNTYTYSYKGINLVNTPGAGFGSYGDDTRGVRVIEIDEKNTSTYETRLINYLDTYVNTDVELNRFKMNATEYGTFISILNGIRYFYKSVEAGKNVWGLIYEVICTFL